MQLALLASRADLLWQQAAEAAGGALRLVDWRAFAMTTLIAVAICSFKFLLDWLSGKEGERARWGKGGNCLWDSAACTRGPFPVLTGTTRLWLADLAAHCRGLRRWTCQPLQRPHQPRPPRVQQRTAAGDAAL